ncbi:uncharacterized protein LOC133338527 [Musca vetustissima]|uniref:uncharacterized protein LOC133338527 n=1 Tax=Musca vetustissima TaxID=27455 RepID=UPI002AB616E1|nr:uncharacterized protein LOC133338527 [Musca vetustissima]
MKCYDHDPAFARFEICKLKVVRRGVVSLNVRVGLYQTPVTNTSINIAVYKRANGYRPFLYNISEDACAFLANRKRYPVLKVLLDVLLAKSNLNHTCPFTDAIVVNDMVLEDKSFNFLPVPEGEYLFKMKVFAYNDLKATIEVYVYRRE